MQKSDKYQVVSTKISNESFRLLHQLCARKGVTIYEFLQMTCDTLIRYMDDRHNMTPEMEQTMSIFDHMQGWKKALNLCDPTAHPEVHQATYYLAEEGKVGTRAVHVEIPWMGEEVATCNIQDILERTLCLLVPDRYKRLRRNAALHHLDSIIAYIDMVLNRDDQEEDLMELRRDFMDCRRTKYGNQDVGDVYMKKKARGFDNLADRKRILGEEQDLWASIENGNIDSEEEDDGTLEGICEADEFGAMATDEDAEDD